MVRNASAICKDLVPSIHFNLFEYFDRVWNSFVVEGKVEVDAGPDVVSLGDAAGYKVVGLEKNEQVCGRASLLEKDGF